MPRHAAILIIVAPLAFDLGGRAQLMHACQVLPWARRQRADAAAYSVDPIANVALAVRKYGCSAAMAAAADPLSLVPISTAHFGARGARAAAHRRGP